MPRYDYRCSACGSVYEKREGFDAPSVQACSSCQGEARRVLTPPAIVFKGSGWYINDSRKPSGDDSPPPAVGAASSPGAESSPATTPDSKPDGSKPDTKPAKTESKAAAAD